MALPQPTSEALAVSHALKQRMIDSLKQHSNWLSFADYMARTLYTPGLGYYSGGSAKLGKDGDFTTAPELSPFFGQTLAQLCASLLEQTAHQILEFGAGSGRLAFDILTQLKALGMTLERYAILDLSGELRARQQLLLAPFPEVVWLDRLPQTLSGVMLANEVLDAIPVQLVRKTGEGWMEVGVSETNGEFIWSDRPCPPELLKQIAAQIPEADALPAGYTTEIHPAACAFMQTLGALGDPPMAAVLIDYGFPAREYYLDQRTRGTLMCHYRHHAHDDPFFWPGLQDITSHVDFSAMAAVAQAGGLDVLAYMNQASFLIGAGLTERLATLDPADTPRYLAATNAINRLTSPAEMGELFKVLIVGRGVELPAPLLRLNRAHRL